jgi:phosphoadenosine phosphosulfate reductase
MSLPPSPSDRHLSTAHAVEIVAETLSAAEQPCVTASFQAESLVLLHMLRQQQPHIPVLFVDTCHHFPETLEYVREMTRAWELNLITVRAAEPSVGLWQAGTDRCCARHKVEPLFAALQPYDVWFTGRRRAHSLSRASLAEFESFTLPTGQVLRKVNPLAGWTDAMLRAYTRGHHIPLLPLYDQGYTSIGCEPCTTPPTDPANPRSGRWGGEKLECGIHLQPVRG